MMWFFWIPVLLLGFLFFRREVGPGVGCMAHTAHDSGAAQATNGPVDVLRQRLARGEITPEEYEKVLSRLS